MRFFSRLRRAYPKSLIYLVLICYYCYLIYGFIIVQNLLNLMKFSAAGAKILGIWPNFESYYPEVRSGEGG